MSTTETTHHPRAGHQGYPEAEPPAEAARPAAAQPAPVAGAARCCPPVEQATCCEPAAKKSCCGAAATSGGGCGCR